jgi:hypothetical protein
VGVFVLFDMFVRSVANSVMVKLEIEPHAHMRVFQRVDDEASVKAILKGVVVPPLAFSDKTVVTDESVKQEDIEAKVCVCVSVFSFSTLLLSLSPHTLSPSLFLSFSLSFFLSLFLSLSLCLFLSFSLSLSVCSLISCCSLSSSDLLLVQMKAEQTEDLTVYAQTISDAVTALQRLPQPRPALFEKDDDSNGHIDFIAAAAVRKKKSVRSTKRA